jgi:hypothetical protein
MQAAAADTLRKATRLTVAAVLGALLSAYAPAQETRAPTGPATQSPPARDIPTPDQLEPGVNTTPAAAPTSAPEVAAGSAPAAQQPTVPARPAAGPERSAAPPSAQAPPAAAASPKEPPVAKTAGRKGGADRLELDTTDITGNRELPKVLYIVPWKRSDLGDLVGKPVNSLLDEVLQPLDRDVFQRENRYYDALKPGQDGAKAGAVQGSDNKP